MRVGFFTHTLWAYGSIHFEMSKFALSQGHTFDVIDWLKDYTDLDFQYFFEYYDRIVTSAGSPEVDFLVRHARSLNCLEKVVVIAHGEPDLVLLRRDNMLGVLNEIGGFGVISDSLYSTCLMSYAINRKPTVVRLGINYDKFYSRAKDKLDAVGYAGSYERLSESGFDIKRGHLAKEATEKANLHFVCQTNLPFQSMPQWYRTIDALVCPSIQEAGGLPCLEAAAAGKLVIGTPVGYFTKNASEGGGIIAPVEDAKFVDFVSEKLRFFSRNRTAYQEACLAAQELAKTWDWSCRIDEWLSFLSDPPK